MTPASLMAMALRRAGVRSPGATDYDTARAYLNFIKTEVESFADWRFLYKVSYVTSAASQNLYSLASDVLTPLFWWDTTNNRRIVVRNPEDIKDIQPDGSLTGDALIVSLYGIDSTTGYWKVDLIPIPTDSGDLLYYQYRAFMPEFTSAMDATDMAPKYPGWLQNALAWGTAALLKEEGENNTAKADWEKYSASLKFGKDLNSQQSTPPRLIMGQGDVNQPFTFSAAIVPE